MSHAAAVCREEFWCKQIRRGDFLRAGADAIHKRIRIEDVYRTTAIRSGAERHEKESAFFDLLWQAVDRRCR